MAILSTLRKIFTADPTEQAEQLIAEALAEAYAGKNVPEGILGLLKAQEKPGIVCAMFFNGRSGSYFAQSFFDHEKHPQVLTSHAIALVNFEDIAAPEVLEPFNNGSLRSPADLKKWCEQFHTISNVPYTYTPYPGQAGFDALLAPKDLYLKFVYAQLLLTNPGNLSTENFLKILFLAYRLARGGAIDCQKPLIYLWQAHTPSVERGNKIKRMFKHSYLLTVVRFFEKSLDSHLVHHLFETVSPPFHTLFRRLCYDLMTLNLTVSDASDGREYAIRFEDLHHHPEHVLQSLCTWFGVEYHPQLCNTAFTMNVQGADVSGSRQLVRREFETKLLNHYDRLKIRFLLQENYRAYGYDALCEPNFQTSLDEYAKDEVARSSPFAAHAIGAFMSGETPEAIAEETRQLDELFRAERASRDRGAPVLPLLYSINNLRLITNQS
jgi:hypothetical protein